MTKKIKLSELGIPGLMGKIEVQVLPEAEIAAQGALHICPKVSTFHGNMEDTVPGSIQVPCSICKELCWMAPSGQLLQAHDAGKGKVPVMCMECCLEMMKAGKS